MIRRALTQFMAGRYGGDQLNMFLIVVYVILCVVGLFVRWGVLELIALVLVIVCLFRMLSRNIDRRRAENAKFLQPVRPVARSFASFRTRMADKDHRYFKCPNCGQQMRVPRGKGRITVHCRSCGATFEEKS